MLVALEPMSGSARRRTTCSADPSSSRPPGTDRRPTGSPADAGRVVLPAVLRVADHHPRCGIGQRPVDAAVELAASRSATFTEVTQLLQLPAAGVVFGSAYSFRNAWPAGLRRSAGMRLPGNGCAGQRIDRRRRRAARDPRAAEVAVALGLRSARTRARTVPRVLLVPLRRCEEMQLVLDDRSANRAAEVVALQLVLRLVRSLEEVVLRVQRVAAAEVEAAAAELVRAAAGDDVDLRAAGLAELRAVAVAQDLELLDRLDRRVDEDRAVRADVVVVRAVDRPEIRGDVAAADREVRAAEQALVLDVEEIGGAHAGHQRGELQEVAAVQRQLADLLSGDHAGDVAAEHLDRGRRRFDADRLVHVAGPSSKSIEAVRRR